MIKLNQGVETIKMHLFRTVPLMPATHPQSSSIFHNHFLPYPTHLYADQSTVQQTRKITSLQ